MLNAVYKDIRIQRYNAGILGYRDKIQGYGDARILYKGIGI